MDDRTLPEPALDAVLRCAALARIAISAEEAERLAPQFARILEAFQVLAHHPLPDVAASSDAAGAPGRTRPDDPQPSLDRERLLGSAPDADGEFFRVPKTVGGRP